MLRPKESLASVITSAPEQPYLRRCVEYALDKTREHNKLELGIAVVLAVITAGATSGVMVAAIVFVASLYAISLFHLARSPKALDERRRKELSATKLLLEQEKAKSADNVLNHKIRVVEAEWEKLTVPERKLLSQFSLEGGEMAADKIQFFCAQYHISNWTNPNVPTVPISLYEKSGLLQETFDGGWKTPEGIREAVENVVYRHLDEHGGLGAFTMHGFIGDSRRLVEAEAKRRAKREYKIERLKELIREVSDIRQKGLTREVALLRRTIDSSVETFLREYFDEAHVRRFTDSGVSALYEFLNGLYDESN